MKQSIVGITADVIEHRGMPACRVMEAYAACVARAGGLPVILPARADLAPVYAECLDALVLTGGDDPIMEDFGVPTHPGATRVARVRQDFELALLRAWPPEKAALGVCLGMQFMGLAAGGRLDQFLPETLTTAAGHWDATHAIVPESGWAFGGGRVHSMHKQALADAGGLRVMARSEDGVIEAVGDPGKPFYIGVQWHPERTGEAGLGQALFDALVRVTA